MYVEGFRAAGVRSKSTAASWRTSTSRQQCLGVIRAVHGSTEGLCQPRWASSRYAAPRWFLNCRIALPLAAAAALPPCFPLTKPPATFGSNSQGEQKRTYVLQDAFTFNVVLVYVFLSFFSFFLGHLRHVCCCCSAHSNLPTAFGRNVYVFASAPVITIWYQYLVLVLSVLLL